MLKIKEIGTMSFAEKLDYFSKGQKEVKAFSDQLKAFKEELKGLYPLGTPAGVVGYKVSYNPEYPVYETKKIKTGVTEHYTVTIR